MKDWTPLWSLLGVGVGWGFTQVSTWLAARQTDQRALKEVLYFLLELHFLLSRAEQIEGHMPAIIAQLRRHMPTPPAEYAAEVEAILLRFARSIVTAMLGQRLTGLQAGYQACLLKLATIEPVSAFRLREQENVLSYFSQAVPIIQEASRAHLQSESPVTAEIESFMQMHVGVDLMQEARDRVQEIVEHLTKQVDRHTRQEVMSTVAKSRVLDPALLGQVDAFIEKAADAFPGLGG